MYEKTGRYYALFGPTAQTTPAEEAFFRHYGTGRARALDLGAGLCGPATLLARLGLDVLAVEPSPVLATLALDRLGREAQKITLVEGEASTLNEAFRADLVLMRSVWMLLNDEARYVALEAARRHCAPNAVLIVDARTAALDWADHPGPQDQRSVGHTTYRRRTRYARRPNGDTEVHWVVEAERFGKLVEVVEESFLVRADTLAELGEDLRRAGFVVERAYSAYDLQAAFEERSAMLVAVGRGGS